MKKCEDIRELISEYIDGDLAGDLLSEFEEHISSCEDCRKELNDVKSIIAMLNDTPDEDLPLNFKDELHERLLEEKAKKKNVISLVFVKYSHIFASAAGFLIIFTIWMVYNNNTALKESLPNVNSIQSYDSKEFSSNGSMESDYAGNTEENINLRTFQNGDAAYKYNEAIGSLQPTQDQNTIAAISDIPEAAINKLNPNAKIESGSQEMKQTQDKIASKASGDINTEKWEDKSISDIASNIDDKNKSISMATIGTVSDENLYTSADFTLNTKDTSSGIAHVRSIVLSLGGEELATLSMARGTESSQKVIGEIPNSMAKEPENAELLNFKIPANSYDLFCQKANETFGSSNIIINGVTNSDYESRKKEIQTEVSEIDNKITSNADNSKWSSSNEYKELINKKNILNKELDEIKAGSQYTIVTIKIQKIK